MLATFNARHNIIKDPHRYAVQVIRRGGNNDAHSCFFAWTAKIDNVMENVMEKKETSFGKYQLPIK